MPKNGNAKLMRRLREVIAGYQRGFTLIELMIVAALIGILTAMAFPLYANIQVRARVTRARADLRTLASAVAIYAANTGKLPASLNNLTTTVKPAKGKVAVAPYMKKLPDRPNTTWTNYTYKTLAGKGTFQITTSSKVDKASLKAP